MPRVSGVVSEKLQNSKGEGGIEKAIDADFRLREEINILKLEGSIFCFDPREAKQRHGTLEFDDIRKGAPEKKVHVKIDPDIGQPSVLAYKVLQAIFYKIAEEGVTFTEAGRAVYSDQVAFSQRELARLVGRKGWGRTTSKQLHDAIMQLMSIRISASFFDKDRKVWGYGVLVIIPDAQFSGRGESISECLITLAPKIVDSLNRQHIATFNLVRLHGLSPIGLVLYKQIFYNFSHLHDGKRNPKQIRFQKDYEAVCIEWLGRLKTRPRIGLIEQQLGQHLDDLVTRRLIRKWDISKNKRGDGFNLTFWPGEAFFHDYDLYYRDSQNPRFKQQPTPALYAIQKPFEVVAHFHQRLGRKRSKFHDTETDYARELIERHGVRDVHDLIEYGVAKAAETGFQMAVFNGLKVSYDDWCADRARRQRREANKAKIDACPYCPESGMLELRKRDTHQHFVHTCPHEPTAIEKLTEKLEADRI